MRGSHQDFTAGSLNRSILLLAIPMVLEMVLESLFAVVDVFWVSRLGSDAIATVGLTESVLTLVFAVGIGLAMSTTAMVARRIGEKDREGAAVAAVQAMALGIFVSILMGIPFFFFAPHLLALMGASPAIVASGVITSMSTMGSSTIGWAFSTASIKALRPAVTNATSFESTGWLLPSNTVTRTSCIGKPASGPLSIT